MDADRRRTVAAAAHPVALAGAALIVLNDYVLTGQAPGWLTGKLSDVGWLVVTPVLCAAVLALGGVRAKWARGVGLVATTAFYVTLQLWPPLGLALRHGHVADAEDLLVLPALIGAVVAWRRARAGLAPGLVAVPVLAAALVADDSTEPGPASWPCGNGMAWDPAVPFVLQLGGGMHDSDAFLRGMRLTDDAGQAVPLVAAAGGGWTYRVCARDGLRGDTAYTWEIGPWDPQPSNELWGWSGQLPTVRFRTLPADGPPAPTAEACAALAEPVDTGADEPATACGIGGYRDVEDTDADSGDTGDTADGSDTDTP